MPFNSFFSLPSVLPLPGLWLELSKFTTKQKTRDLKNSKSLDHFGVSHPLSAFSSLSLMCKTRFHWNPPKNERERHKAPFLLPNSGHTWSHLYQHVEKLWKKYDFSSHIYGNWKERVMSVICLFEDKCLNWRNTRYLFQASKKIQETGSSGKCLDILPLLKSFCHVYELSKWAIVSSFNSR